LDDILFGEINIGTETYSQLLPLSNVSGTEVKFEIHIKMRVLLKA